jgi:DNA mismatch repair protein MutS
MPPSLVDRANEILLQLEDKHVDDEIPGDKSPIPKASSATAQVKNLTAGKMQLNIFDLHSQTFEEIRELLNSIDINRLTPVEALLKLQEIKQKVK